MEKEKEKEKEEVKRYSVAWFCEELVRGIFIAIALFVLQIAGTGILQAYLLPERLEKEAAKMQAKFDEQFKVERNASVKRESELIESLETLKKEYSEALVEVRKAPPLPPALPSIPTLPTTPNVVDPSQIQNWKNINEQRLTDPEKKRLQYLQQHTKN